MIVGIDMGGTNIDGVIVENGKIINTIKRGTNRDNILETILSTLKELLKDYDKNKIERINLSTTISTNSIIENKTSPVGMLIQSGPGLLNSSLACGNENVFLSGYIDHRGNEIEKLDLSEIKKAMDLFKNKKLNAFAVVTKFSTRNPKYERMIKEILEKEFTDSFITMGHSISGKLNFPRRVYTSYLNSAVYSIFNNFAINVKKSLEIEGIKAPVYILKADGGTMTIDEAINKPVETILSGPAASLMGINALLPSDSDAILLDIGGTTTDIFFLADGVPLFEPLGIKIGKYKTLVRAIYSVSIGLGGDSAIDIVNGNIKIGPLREGKPFAFGGPKPTPTDALITLGLIDDNVFSYGKNSRDDCERNAFYAMKLLSKKLNISEMDTAKLILDTMGNTIKNKVDNLLIHINSHPVYTIKELLYGKKVKPKVIKVIGGPSKSLSTILNKKFNLPCYYPKNYQVANAVGAALARPTTEITMLIDTSKKIISVPELNYYEKTNIDYTLDSAKKKALELINEKAKSIGANYGNFESEITEESSFNMVRGFYTIGKNIRVKAQIKPGLIHQLRGDYIES